MDPVDEIFIKHSFNARSIENDEQITYDKLQQMISLQYQKLSVLKKAKSYWENYCLVKDKRKRNFGKEITTVVATNSENNPFVYSGMPHAQPLTAPKYIFSNRLAAIGSYNATSNVVYCVGNVPNLIRQSGNAPNTTITNLTSSSVNRINQNQKFLPIKCPQPQIQQPISSISNTLFNKYKKYALPHQGSEIKHLTNSISYNKLPYIQPYISTKTINEIASDIVCNYYVNVGEARSYSTKVQKKLIHHTTLPMCCVCHCDTSSFWHKSDDSVNTNGSPQYKCHRCVTFYETNREYNESVQSSSSSQCGSTEGVFSISSSRKKSVGTSDNTETTSNNSIESLNKSPNSKKHNSNQLTRKRLSSNRYSALNNTLTSIECPPETIVISSSSSTSPSSTSSSNLITSNISLPSGSRNKIQGSINLHAQLDSKDSSVFVNANLIESNVLFPK